MPVELTKDKIIFQLTASPDADVKAEITKQIQAVESQMLASDPVNAHRAAERRLQVALGELEAAQSRLQQLAGIERGGGHERTPGLIETKAAAGEDTTGVEKELAEIHAAIPGLQARVKGITERVRRLEGEAQVFCRDFLVREVAPLAREVAGQVAQAHEDLETRAREIINGHVSRLLALEGAHKLLAELTSKDGVLNYLKRKHNLPRSKS